MKNPKIQGLLAGVIAALAFYFVTNNFSLNIRRQPQVKEVQVDEAQSKGPVTVKGSGLKVKFID